MDGLQRLSNYPRRLRSKPQRRGGDVSSCGSTSAGSGLTYATFLGGGDWEVANAIAVDEKLGNAYVTGDTASSDLPTTADAFDPSYNGGGDSFVAKLNTTGQQPSVRYVPGLGA